MTVNRKTPVSVISLAQPHDSATEHVTGTASFIDDMEPAKDQLFVAIGKSTIAKGKILSMELSGVAAAEGVVDVLTFKALRHAWDIAPVFDGDPLLVNEEISHYGQALFAVAATSHKLACRAVLNAKIRYAEQQPELSIARAVKQQFFVRPPHRMKRGESTKALHNATHRVKGAQSIGGQEHFYLEGQIARARLNDDNGVTIWSSNQNPSETQHVVAKVLGLSMNRVNVIVRRLGGGFGGKETQATACAAFAAIFASRTGRVVSCRLSRRDDMQMTGKRHGFLNRYEVGFDEEGLISAAEFVLAAQCGHSADLSDAIVDRAMFHCDNAYYLPEVTIDGLRCKTNTVSNTAFRGFGGPQGMMAMETVIDEIAYKLDKDPLDIRMLNLYGTDERNITPYYQRVNGSNLKRLLNELEQTSNYRERRESIDEFNAHASVHRKGLAITPVKFGISFTVKHLNQGGALINIYSDGSVQLNHGGTEMGQGLMVKVQQVVAQELGMSMERIAITATSTDKVPNTSATAASSGTDLNGMAALLAARKIKKRLIRYLRARHGVEESSISFSGDCIAISTGKASTAAYSWPEMAAAAYRDRISLSATGYYRTPKIFYDRKQAKGQPFYYFSCGAAVSEVMIDILTGETEILRADVLHDVGNSINPAIDIGQIEGGFVQGAGWLTVEELHWNEKGQLLTDSPATYKIPAISDMPQEFNVELLENSPNDVATIFRSKAVGEPPLMLAISVFSAIRDAVGSLAGHRVFPVLNAPATPEEVLRACNRLRQSADFDG
ncbi:MAG: xanthine dehydrogenase molybdopterin binding subunit [Granulosicoccus sp.]|nr:xanthine dehydrogenase molybdopterin binding subunit [Granulosicoccus sp.]